MENPCQYYKYEIQLIRLLVMASVMQFLYRDILILEEAHRLLSKGIIIDINTGEAADKS